MKRLLKGKVIGLAGFVFILFLTPAVGQVSPSFTQFYVNPYHFNPSYAGIEGRPTLFLYYRQQWVGIEGAPATANLSFHTPLALGLTFGLDVYNDKRGVINTNNGMVSIGYVVPFSRTTFLRFGISGGAGFRNLDLSSGINTSDPAILNIASKKIFVTGNVGVSFQSGYFNFGASLPTIFQPDLRSISALESSYIKPLDEVLLNVSYRFYFADDALAVEPEILYRYNKDQPSQFEGAGILHIRNLVWLGGSFRQDYGLSAFAGLKLKNFFSFGYSYGIGSKSLPGIGNSTHEFLLTLFTGKPKRSKKKDTRLYLSFIDAEKYNPPKPEKKPVVVAKQEVKKPETKPVETKPVETKPVAKDTIPAVTQIKPADTTRTQVAVVEKKEPSGPRLQMFDKKVIPQTPKDTLRDTVSIKQTQVKPLENEPPVREEIVKKGNSASELPVGSYIIVGAYNYKENADKMTSMALNLGYPAAVGFVSEKGYWYVYVKKGDSPDEIRPILPQVRQSMKIKDAWILTVYDGNQMTAGATSNPAVSPDTIQTVNLDTTSQVGKEAGALAKEEGIKVEMVHKGDNMFELLTGNYIIVGVFSTFEAAERYSDQLHRIGQNVKWGFNTSKNLWYDYLFFSATMDGIRDQLDNARKVPQMKDSWLLIVQ